VNPGFSVRRAKPEIGEFGLLNIPAQADAPTQVIYFYRLYEGSRKGDVIVWLQNVSSHTVRYVTYRLRVPRPGKDQASVVVGGGHPGFYLISSDVTFDAPPAAPGERLVMIIPHKAYDSVRRATPIEQETGLHEPPELVFESVENDDRAQDGSLPVPQGSPN
jgi:hypothetical protein